MPVTFKKKGDFKVGDTRFQPVEIVLMNLGENYNGSYFSREVVTAAIPSLANTPILAYIEKNENDEDDFTEHERKIVKNPDNGYEFEYLGRAIGMIPENNNARFVEIIGDDEIQRTHLVVDGLIWTKWKQPLRIFESRDGIVSQSMELHEDFEGEFKEDGLFHFTDFKFFGACALGEGVPPAMEGANIQLKFSIEDFEKETQEKMEEFKLFQLNRKKGGDSVDKKLELLAKFSKTEDDVKAMEIDLEKIAYEDLEAKLEESAKEPEGETPEKDEDNPDVDVDVDETDEDEANEDEGETGLFTKEFSLSHDDIRSKLYGHLSKKEEVNETYYWIVQVYDDSFVYQDGKDGKCYKTNYTATNTELTIGEDAVEVFSRFLTQEEVDSLDSQVENYATLEEEVKGLRVFQETRLAEDRKVDEETLFEKYKSLDGMDDYEKIKEKSSEFTSIEDLEKEIALVFARNFSKINFSKNEIEKNQFNFDEGKEKDSRYGGLLEKYGSQAVE